MRVSVMILLACMGCGTASAADTVTYTYDSLGRLVQVVRNGVTTSYTYDQADNRVTVQTSG